MKSEKNHVKLNNSKDQSEEALAVRRILDTIPAMPPALKKVGEFVAKYPEEVLSWSVTDLAEKTQTSEASVVRFCRMMNYKGYQDFKIHLSRSLISPLHSLHDEIKSDDTPGELTRKVFGITLQTLKDTLEIINEEAMEKAIQLLANANRVECIGFGGSAAIAFDAHHKLVKTGIACYAYNDGHLGSMVASTFNGKDVVLAISYSGTTEDVLQVATVAKEAGAKIIAITNHARSPLSRLADVLLNTSSPESKYRSEGVSSRIAQLCIIDTLYIGVILANQPTALITLQKTREAASKKHI